MSNSKFLCFKFEYGWILSRDKNFRQTKLFDQVLKMAVDEFAFKTENAIRCDQGDCSYDYVRKRRSGKMIPKEEADDLLK